MRTIDFRAVNYDPDRDGASHYAVLGASCTHLFHEGEGNRFAWDQLERMLDMAVPGGHHVTRGDIEITARGEVVLHSAADDHEAAAWFCSELVARGIVPRSARVCVPDGAATIDIGAVGGVARAGAPLALAMSM